MEEVIKILQDNKREIQEGNRWVDAIGYDASMESLVVRAPFPLCHKLYEEYFDD